MNKIYKVIWSKVKNCYVVASELAKAHTKSPKSGVIGCVLLENKITSELSKGFVAGVFPVVSHSFEETKPFKITVAAIVKNEAENVPIWVQSARSCADEIVVVDTGSTDGTVERFRDYGIECYHYEWNDDFASAKNYMISLCHGDWIVLLDGDEWFREGCDVRKAIAKHHNNPVTKAIIADWICLDKDRGNAVMFSGGAVRAFRNQPDVRYFRKVHENLTINYENFAFEPDFKMYHTGYSGSVNRSKHERNLRIMRTMFDFDNGKVEYPTDWRYIEDTYAGLGNYPKALWAADKMISYGVQEYSAAAWITKFNVLFAMKTPMEEMKKQFEYCFKTVPSVSGFRFLASIYYFRNEQIELGLDNYIEGLRMLMGPQDKVAMEHTYWRMYMPEASALASAVYLQNKQFEASLYACKVSEQYCGQTDWTNHALADVRRVMDGQKKISERFVADSILPVLRFARTGVLATALVSSLSVGMVNDVYAGCVIGGCCNSASGANAIVVGGCNNYAIGNNSLVIGGYNNIACAIYSFVIGGSSHTAKGSYSSVSGGFDNTSSGCFSSVSGGSGNKASGGCSSISGGFCNTASGSHSWTSGGCCGIAYADYSSSIGGGITGNAECTIIAIGSVAIGKCATTTQNYEVAIGSACAPVTIGGDLTITGTNVKIDGVLTVDGTKSITDGTTTKTWEELLTASAGCCNTASGCYSAVSGGFCNTASGNYSSVSGGGRNIASCGSASVSGGAENRAVGSYSSVSGGQGNIAGGISSSVSGGIDNVAGGSASSVSGGENNTASGCFSSVSGGIQNKASCNYASVVGGMCNVASGCSSFIAGGRCNVASNNYSLIIGGSCNEASGAISSIIGGSSNIANGDGALVSGGSCNKASGSASLVSGGFHNEARDIYSSVLGGYANLACSRASLVNGGLHNVASGCYSIVSGGKCNTANGNSSAVIGGCNGIAYADYSTAIGGGITGNAECATTALGSVAIGSGATTTQDNEIAIGSVCAPVTIGGNLTIGSNLTIDGEKAITDGTTTKTWAELLNPEYGYNNIASGCYSLVTGGICNTASGCYSSISGGQSNTAWDYSSVSGGYCNTARCSSSVSGGYCNTSMGTYSSVSGGICNLASGENSSISGGKCNVAGFYYSYTNNNRETVYVSPSCDYIWGDKSRISVGSCSYSLTAHAGGYDSVSGGSCNIAGGGASSVSGGYRNVATGSSSTVSGGFCNIAIGSSSVVSGGSDNLAQGHASWVAGGCSGIAYACYSTVIGGGIAGVSTCAKTALGSVAIGKQSQTTRDYEIAIGSACAPVKIDGELTVDGVKIVTDGINSKTWTELLTASGGSSLPNTLALGTCGVTAACAIGKNSIAIGEGAVAFGIRSISIGTGNIVTGSNSGAFGDPNIVNGANSYVVGNNSTVSRSSSNVFVLGNNTSVTGSNTVVLGGSSTDTALSVSGSNSVILGADSDGSQSNVVSVGATGNERKIVHIANGSVASGSTDAVTGGQLYDAIENVNGTIANGFNVIVDGVTVKNVNPDSNHVDFVTGNNMELVNDNGSVKISAKSDGVVAEGNTGLVSGDTVYQAVKANTDAIDVLNTASVENTSDIESLKNLSNISNDGQTAIRNLAQEAVKVINGVNTTVIEGTDGSVKTYAVNVTTDGAIDSGNTGIVTGGTVYNEVRPDSDGNFVTIAGTTGSNLTALDTQLKTTIDNLATEVTNRTMAVSDEATARANADTALGNRIDGTITDLSVNGQTITYAKGDGTTGTITTQDNNTEYTAGNGLELTGTEFKAKAGTNVTIDANGINVVGNGSVDNGNMGLVSGGTVFSETRLASNGNYIRSANSASQNLIALDTAVKTNADTLDAKANVDLDNISTDGVGVIRDIAKQSVKVINGANTTVTEGTDGDAKTYAVNVAIDGSIAENNTGLVTGGDIYDYVQDITSGAVVPADLEAYAKKDASNLAGEASNWGTAIGTGTIAENNGELVTGGTVYNALKDATDTVNSNLEAKANVSLDNITIDGETTVKTLAKGSVNVVGDGKASVNKTDVDGVDTYTVSVLTDGAIAEGNTGIVSGGAVYEALQSLDIPTVSTDGVIDEGNTGLLSGGTAYRELRPGDGEYVKQAQTTAQNLTALDSATRNNTSAITNLGNVLDSALDGIATTMDNKANVDASNVTDDLPWATALGKGEVAQGNSQLVTGGTVYNALTDLNFNIDTALSSKADVKLNNIDNDGQSVVKSLARQSVQLEDGNHTAVAYRVDGDNYIYKVNVKDDGQVDEGDTGLVTGGTVYNKLKAYNDNLTTILDGVVSSIEDDLDTKAKKNLSNLDNSGKNVVRGLAQQSVKVVPGTNTNVTVSADGGAITYAVDVATNGTISDSSEGIVSGKTVYEEVRPTADGNYIRTDFTAGSNLKALDDQVKVNADAIQALQNSGGCGVLANMVAYDDNTKATVTLAGQDGTTIKNVKAGIDTSDAVNVGQLQGIKGELEGRIKVTEDLLAGDWGGKTVKESIDDKVDNSTFNDYKESTANTIATMNNVIQEKANKDLDNISDNGKSVVRGLAQEAIDVVGSGAVSVTSSVDNDVKTYTVSVATDGVVEANNEGIVTGGTVYNAIQEANTATQVALDGKANASLDNITDDGKAVIRNVVADDFNNKANIDLDNISDVGRNVIRDAVKDDFAKKADKDAVYSKEETDGLLADKADISYVDAGLSAKADTTYVDSELGKKADKTELDKKADIAYVDEGLSKKADKSELATKANADGSNIDIAKWSESLGDGVIEEGNTGLVNGGTVYEALQSVSGNDMIASDFETGTIHIGGNPKYDELRAIDFSTSDGNGRVLTGVVTNPYDATSAANVGYVNAVGESIMDRMNRGFDETNKRTNKVGAGASAMASLMPAPMDGDEKWSFSAAVGNYKNETAAAVGAFFRPTDNVIFNLRGTVGSDENMVGGGVSVALQRGNTPGVSKAQLVKTINTQAGKIQEMEANYNAKISEMEARHNAEMAEMKERIAMMEEMMNKHN